MTFPTKSDAFAYLATVEADLIRGQWKAPVRSDATVKSFGQAWIRQNPHLKDSTRIAYANDFRLHIEPLLGHYRLDQLKPEIIREWRATVGDRIRQRSTERDLHSASRRQTGKSTQARAYRVLHAILRTAVEDGLLDANPCRMKRGGEYDAAERPTLSTAEIELLAEVIDPHYKTYVYVAAYMGLRLGEMTGLRHKHVDLDEGTVRIVQTEGRHTTPETPSTPKSDAGNRTLLMPPFFVDMLREHMRCQATIDPDAYVFNTRRGKNVYYGAPRALRRALTTIGRPEVVGHDLRHIASGLKAQSGATLADLQRDLGHSTVDAVRRYMHANVESQRAVADRLDQRRSATVNDSAESAAAPLTARSG